MKIASTDFFRSLLIFAAVVVVISLLALASVALPALNEGFEGEETPATATTPPPGTLDPKKICICMLYTPNIASYSAITEEINRAYADRWGYSMHVYKKRMANDRAPQWDKIQAVLHLMDDPAQYEYIFWIDSDAYFNDHTKPIDEIIDFTKGTDVHISTDLPYGVWTVNTGVFCVKNNDWVKQFFQKIWSSREYLYEYCHEQSVMSILIDSNFAGAQARTTIYPVDIINNNNPGDPCFICHMMGQKTQYRVNHAKARLQKLKQGVLEPPGPASGAAGSKFGPPAGARPIAGAPVV